MQGDIFQLEDILRHQAEARTIAAPLKPSSNTVAIRHYDDDDDLNSATSPHISVYNEDDISAYLYNGVSPLLSYHHETIPKISAPVDNAGEDQAHYLEAIASAFDDYYTDAPSVLPPHPIDTATKQHTYHHHHHHQHKDNVPHFSIYAYDSVDEDECAISTDDEDEDDSHSSVGTPATPTSDSGLGGVNACRHFHTHHIDSPPVRPVLHRKRDSIAPRERTSMESAKDAVQTTAAVPRPMVATVTRPSPRSCVTAMIPPRQHVDHIEGRLMSWWPLPLEKAEYEWNERFYE